MTKLTILQINDLHGYIEPHPEMVRRPDGAWRFETLGGLARITALFDAVRTENPEGVIALDNGDTFHGTHVAVVDQGRRLIPLMNAVGLDAMTVHWEFAYGPAGVLDIGRALNYPILAINCHAKADDKLVFPPYRMLDRAGLRIAVIGLACPIVDKTMPPKFSEGVYFTIGDEALPRWIKHVKEEEKAALVVVLSHLGFPQDVKLAKTVDGIDVLVSGHTHNRMDHAITVNGAVIFQSGCHGSFVGRLDLDIEAGKIAGHKHRLVPVDGADGEDAALADAVGAATAPEKDELCKVVGETGASLHRYAMLSTPMDDLLLEAVAEAAGREIAFSNGWRYGAPIPAGPVTVNDLWNIIPTNPPVSIVDLTGAEICQMLEESLERTFAADPFEQMGGYVKRMRGVTLYFKAENPAGHRIDRLFILGAPVESDRLYPVAFLTAQGVPGKFGVNRAQLEVMAVDALKAMFARRGRFSPSDTQSVFEV